MREPIPEKVLSPLSLKIVLHKNTEQIFVKKIIIGVCIHNNSQTIQRCIRSIIDQDIFNECAIVILDDYSSDNWMDIIKKELELYNILVIKGNCGTPARARNAILDFVDDNFIEPKWIARLDADDKFSSKKSLSQMCQNANIDNIDFIIGGNRLVKDGKLISKVNLASKKLFDKNYLIKILQKMAFNEADNELPSCNLVLKANSGIRYPDIISAEDHYLVSMLLFFHFERGVILENLFYCDYSLSGQRTYLNKKSSIYQEKRKFLYQIFLLNKTLYLKSGKLLGYGLEGVVFKDKDKIKKYFYPNIINQNQINFLDKITNDNDVFVPKIKWKKESSWICIYQYFDSCKCTTISIEQAKEFLLFCLQKKIVCLNIKRSNFRISKNKLIYIDIGNSIKPMDIKYFIDSAARLYCISSLNCSDYELQRRKNIFKLRQENILNKIPGFFEFYNDLLISYSTLNWIPFLKEENFYKKKETNECSLMIKACAMDYDILEQQVKHIVFNLEIPRSFFQKILLIDSHKNNFLRQYQKPNLRKVCLLAQKLKKENIVDRVIVSPRNIEKITEINLKWFGLDCKHTHSDKNAPVFSQIWAFEQIKTPYLLQCDIDILIGKKDLSHDYLKEMLVAIKDKGVIGVAFNIPHNINDGYKIYDAPMGEYVPEVRCGLLDLVEIKKLLPLENEIKNEKLALSWFRALHKTQSKSNKRTLRGGDPKTFYIHPQNHWKKNVKKLFEIQDLVNQCKIPSFQFEKWDLEGTTYLWEYKKRDEDIIFLIKGQNISKTKINRCFASLKMQRDQDFGVIVIDDASSNMGIEIPTLLDNLNSKTTLIRNYKNEGRIPNFIRAINEICINTESLIVILDLDDALIDKDIVLKLKTLVNKGYDVIHGGMFRPNKPLKLYIPNYDNPRKIFGGNVWTHLRSFKKELFEKIDENYFKDNNDWIHECTDYATMIPLVELCKKPIFIPEYWYLHENTNKRTKKRQLRKTHIINQILNKPFLIIGNN